MRFHTRGVDETRAAGAALAGVLAAGDLVVLAGELGSGKTAFAQGVGRGLDVSAPVVSPSFVIVREYEGRVPLVHVDVYRLERFQELFDLGFEEVLGPDRVTVVEWGDRVTPVLPADRLEVRLGFGDDPGHRVLDVEARGNGWARRRVEVEAALDRWRGGG